MIPQARAYGPFSCFGPVYLGPRQLPKLAYVAPAPVPCALCGVLIPRGMLFTLSGRTHAQWRPRCAVCVPYRITAPQEAHMPSLTQIEIHQRANEKRAAILRFIGGWIELYGYSPTVREIAAGVEISSGGLIAYHLGILERDGWITRGAPGQRKNAPRTIRLAGLGELSAAQPRKRGYA